MLKRAAEVGRHAAKIEASLAAHGQVIEDRIHHLGDDTGRLIVQAYEMNGADSAADVVMTYLESFNAIRAENGIDLLSPADAIHNLQWCINSSKVDRAAQEKIRAAFNKRW